MAVRIDLLLVVAEGADFGFGEKLQLGDADAVLAGNHAIQRTGEVHDALDRLVGGLQHLVIVGIDRDVGMHVAIAGVHVQRDEDAATQDFLVDGLDALDDRAINPAVEDLGETRFQLLLPRSANRVVLQAMKELRINRLVGQLAGLYAKFAKTCFGFGQWQVEAFQQPGPASADGLDIIQRGLTAVADQHLLVEVGVTGMQRQLALEESGQRIAQGELVLRGQFDVDALDAVAVVAHTRQRNHHVLVHLEGVGVTRDGGGTRTVEPEFLARFGVDRDEALGRAQVAHADHFGSGGHHCFFVVTDEVADQHHLRATMALGLGRVADGLHIALVHVFQTGQQDSGGLAVAARFEVIGDFDDGRHCFAHLAEKFEANSTRHWWHLVQYPARGDDDAIGALLLHARHAAEELVGDVLAQSGLATGGARQGQLFLAEQLPAARG